MELNLIHRRMSTLEANQLNPLVLAYVGDAVFEVVIRAYLAVNNISLSAHKLHVKAISYVKAHAQSEFIKALQAELSEEELGVFRRGRNAKSSTVPKNADIQEYRAATGFEALIGFLYLTDQGGRLMELLGTIIKGQK